MFDVLKLKKELKNLDKHLRSKSDEKLIDGYKQAMIDRETTGNQQLDFVVAMIKKEIDRRGLKVE